MKTRFTLLGIVAAVVIGIAAVFVSCNKELNDITTYRGEVVYINTTTPFPNLQVKVTDGKNTHCQTLTDDAGQFSLKVRVNEIDGNYYLLAGDSTCLPKKVALGGYGHAEMDLGTIEVEGPSTPTVKTDPVSEVTADGATIGGEVMTDGRLSVTARGICYGTEQQPSINGSYTTDGSGLGAFTSILKNLEHNTIYYARAYATNRMGTAYGEQVKFTTEEGVPVVVTDSVIRITAHTARCKGHVESDGGYQVTKRGTCWSTYPDPTIDDECTDNGSGLGEFSSNLTNLQKDTKYYVRTFATNSTATVYGEQLTFTTLDGLATVNTNQATTTATSINVSCEVVDDGGFAVTERGVCYSAVNAEPLIEDGKVEYGRGKGSYNVSITELSAATTYYVRAYAVNENGTAYGKVLPVTTKDGMAAITLGAAKNITALTASCDVKVSDAGGATLQSCGVCWSTMPNPTIDNSKANGGSALNTTYSCNMTDLAPATTYYVRGYATTDIATSYSAQMTFQTQSGLPIVLTDSVTANSVSITGYGNVTSDAGYSITARGVCYSTSNSTPTIADSYTTAGVGTGIFSSVVTDVSLSTTYYVRAYATNSIGTGYGQTIMITTGNGIPTVKTTAVTLNGNILVSGGYISDDGGSPVTARGVCYGVYPLPDLSDTYNHTTDGAGIGYYTSTLGSMNGTIYVRAYATNARGTTYGNEYSVDISYLELPTFIFNEKTYKVAPAPSNKMKWYNANTYCEGLSLYGYSDWRLPDKDELYQMFVYQDSIGGFVTTSSSSSSSFFEDRTYWSSSVRNDSIYLIIFGYAGAQKFWVPSSTSGSFRVRPIREIIE